MAIKVEVLFFGATADVAGTRQTQFSLPDGIVAEAALACISENFLN